MYIHLHLTTVIFIMLIKRIVCYYIHTYNVSCIHIILTRHWGNPLYGFYARQEHSSKFYLRALEAKSCKWKRWKQRKAKNWRYGRTRFGKFSVSMSWWGQFDRWLLVNAPPHWIHLLRTNGAIPMLISFQCDIHGHRN